MVVDTALHSPSEIAECWSWVPAQNLKYGMLPELLNQAASSHPFERRSLVVQEAESKYVFPNQDQLQGWTCSEGLRCWLFFDGGFFVQVSCMRYLLLVIPALWISAAEPAHLACSIFVPFLCQWSLCPNIPSLVHYLSCFLLHLWSHFLCHSVSIHYLELPWFTFLRSESSLSESGNAHCPITWCTTPNWWSTLQSTHTKCLCFLLVPQNWCYNRNQLTPQQYSLPAAALTCVRHGFLWLEGNLRCLCDRIFTAAVSSPQNQWPPLVWFVSDATSKDQSAVYCVLVLTDLFADFSHNNWWQMIHCRLMLTLCQIACPLI